MSLLDLDQVSSLKVLTEEGVETSLSDFWGKTPAILIFVRHFSSQTCREHVQSIWKEKERFMKSKYQIVFVGSGSPIAISTFKKELNITDVPVVRDPTLKTFEVFKLTNTGYQAQVGGIVIMKPTGEMVYHFVADYLGTRSAQFSDIRVA